MKSSLVRLVAAAVAVAIAAALLGAASPSKVLEPGKLIIPVADTPPKGASPGGRVSSTA